jgi:hypothetical protein
MARKLSKTEAREILPEIRLSIPPKTQLSRIYSLLARHNPSLARSLLDASVVFDAAPDELKSHIVTCFGVLPDELREYFENTDNERACA